MNAHAKNIKPPEQDTPEALLNTFELADQSHKVFSQYGKVTASFYNVPVGFDIDGKALDGWLAMPLHDSNGVIIGIAYLSNDRNIKPIFDPQLKGCVVVGTPSKDKALFVVSSPEAAFAISLTGNACLLTFTPHDWGGKNSIEHKDAGNMAYVIKAWSAAGYARIYAPVGCDVGATYQLWLKDLSVHVLAMVAPITQYIATATLKAELAALVDSVVDGGNADTSDSTELTDDEIDKAIAYLASLSELQYQRIRKSEASRLGITASFLDKEVKRVRAGSEDGLQGSQLVFLCDTVEPHSSPVNACELFDEIAAAMFGQHTIAELAYQHYATLWGVATWFVGAFSAVPYLQITAPLKDSGKSNFLEVVASFSFRPLIVSDITGSALFRVIEMHRPTLFIDEVDELLGSNDSSGLTGLLNDGYKKTGKVIRCVGEDHSPRQFNVFGFKALCGIGQLKKATTASRCVRVEVRPMSQGESIKDILHISDNLLSEINSKLKRLRDDNFDAVREYDGNHIQHLINREKQIWHAVYAVAAIGGEKWINHLKKAEQLTRTNHIETPDDKIQLLADIKQVFEKMRVTRITSSDLLERLCSDDDAPWSTWTQGKPMTARQLAGLLGDFKIKSKDVRIGSTVLKGYELSDFKDAFNRYFKATSTDTPKNAATTLQPNDSNAFSYKSSATNDANVADDKQLEPLQTMDCSGVADNQGSLYL